MHLAARRAAEFGVDIEGRVSFNLRRAVSRKDGIVQGIIDGVHANLRGHDNIRFIRARARFTSEHELNFGDGRLSFDKAIIATGARRRQSRIQGTDGLATLDNRSALQLAELPESLIVVGGGYVGVEFAQMYSRFGTRVTLLGRNANLLPGEDRELTDALADYLREEGIDVRTGATVLEASADGSYKHVVIEIAGEPSEIRAEALLLATGRVANVDDLDLDAAGVNTTERGFVSVDDSLLTSQPHIGAIGDVKGGYMFTHVATYDGPLAARNLIMGLDRRTDYRVVPRVIFSDPAFAAVGLSEEEAKRQGFDVAVGVVAASSGRAKAIGDTRGQLKAVVDLASSRLLGFHILAPHGDELIHEAVAAMHGDGTVERISRSIHAHPTLSELLKSAAKAAK